MQKKLIALAVAGLLSAPAFAQSNVTLYGTVDYGFVSMGGASVKHGDHNYKSRNAIDSGVSKYNRIGFKGTEDLGDGLKAVFVLENGLAGDRNDVGIFNGVNRQSYAGLAGGFGTVAFGRHYTPQHLYSAAVDPFGKNGIGGLNNALVQDVRLDNLAAYISPNWGGFSFVAGYTLAGTSATLGTANEAVENDGDIRVWAFAPSFTWDKLFVGANYHAVNYKWAHTKPAGKTTSVLNVFELYASYDFGFVKVGSLVGRRTSKKNSVLTNYNKDAKLTQFMIGATFKITDNDKIMTSYSRASENKVNNASARRISQFSVGYEHALSKRTALYAIGAFQGHNKAFKQNGTFWSFDGAQAGGAVGSVGNNALGYGATPLYKRGIGAGFRHDF
jgi:predicted porin